MVVRTNEGTKKGTKVKARRVYEKRSTEERHKNLGRKEGGRQSKTEGGEERMRARIQEWGGIVARATMRPDGMRRGKEETRGAVKKHEENRRPDWKEWITKSEEEESGKEKEKERERKV